jgi:hypothetical protein
MTLARNASGLCPRTCLALLAMAGLALLPRAAAADDFEREPINYSKAPAANVVTRLQERLDAGQVRLSYDMGLGWLRSVLQELDVPESSQVLVFSKTSMQRDRIGPRTPRALYFNDDTYIGFCQHGKVMEVSTADPHLGTVFYTLEQTPAERPRFTRQRDACLICHASSHTRGVPGHLVRSVFPDPEGFPILPAGTYRIDQNSPLEHRWGGWYVTGTHGKQTHLGNLVVRGRADPEQIDNKAGLNVTDLKGRCDTSAYLTRHSDIVALMVLEHQTEMHNRITQASIGARLALHDEAMLNKELGRAAGPHSETTKRRIKSVSEPLVRYLLFSGEAKLTDPVRGTSGFAEEFVKRGPRDGRGRSLRELDLQRRLFKYPCSHLIYSPAFDALPAEVKDYVWERLWDILHGNDSGTDYDHLTAEDRLAILEILQATRRDLPDYWRPQPPAQPFTGRG